MPASSLRRRRSSDISAWRRPLITRSLLDIDDELADRLRVAFEVVVHVVQHDQHGVGQRLAVNQRRCVQQHLARFVGKLRGLDPAAGAGIHQAEVQPVWLTNLLFLEQLVVADLDRTELERGDETVVIGRGVSHRLVTAEAFIRLR